MSRTRRIGIAAALCIVAVLLARLASNKGNGEYGLADRGTNKTAHGTEHDPALNPPPSGTSLDVVSSAEGRQSEAVVMGIVVVERRGFEYVPVRGVRLTAIGEAGRVQGKFGPSDDQGLAVLDGDASTLKGVSLESASPRYEVGRSHQGTKSFTVDNLAGDGRAQVIVVRRSAITIDLSPLQCDAPVCVRLWKSEAGYKHSSRVVIAERFLDAGRVHEIKFSPEERVDVCVYLPSGQFLLHARVELDEGLGELSVDETELTHMRPVDIRVRAATEGAPPRFVRVVPTSIKDKFGLRINRSKHVFPPTLPSNAFVQDFELGELFGSLVVFVPNEPVLLLLYEDQIVGDPIRVWEVGLATHTVEIQ